MTFFYSKSDVARAKPVPGRVLFYVGSWVWVSFDEKPERETLEQLKEYGFRYSPRRQKWAHNCGHPTRSAVNVNPWDKYEHAVISGKGAK